MTRAQRDVVIWAVIAAGFGWVAVGLDRLAGAQAGTGSSTSAGGTAGQGLWILVPALVAVVLTLVARSRRPDLGLHWHLPASLPWFGVAVAVAAGFAAAPVLAGLAVGAVHLGGGIGDATAAALAVLPFLLIRTIVEEFIFRGYGMGAGLAAGLKGLRLHLVVGSVWALWHLPLFLVWTSDEAYASMTALPKWAFVPLFVVGALALSVVFGELRRHSGSIWPGVVLHCLAGVLSAALLTSERPLAFAGYADAVFSPNTGSLLTTVVASAAGVTLLRLRSRPAPSRLP